MKLLYQAIHSIFEIVISKINIKEVKHSPTKLKQNKKMLFSNFLLNTKIAGMMKKFMPKEVRSADGP